MAKIGVQQLNKSIRDKLQNYDVELNTVQENLNKKVNLSTLNASMSAKANQVDVDNINKKLENYSSYASSKDSNGIYKTVEYKRSNNTLYMKSILSGGTSPNYTTDTWYFYDTNSVILLKTITWTIAYDSDGNIVSKVVS
ncbi:MAG: hypothetical protein N4A50_06185 [Vallitalea sp.]|nr:hypothetical protein [Vallitalea sp.]